MAGADSDLPPPYHALTEDANMETNHFQATEVTPPSNDESETYAVLFEHKDNRIGFIQKVILIKLFQIFLVAVPILVFMAKPYAIYNMLQFDNQSRANMLVAAFFPLLVVLILIHICDEARVIMPYNYLFLLAYPLSIGFFIAVVTWRVGALEVFTSWMQFFITVFFILVYSVLSLQSKLEFKTSIGIFLAADCFILSYALTVPFVHVNAFAVLYCSVALFGLTVYMLYDIQIMTSRNYRLQLSPSDFVKAAVIMHIDYLYLIKNVLKKYADKIDDSLLNDAA